MLWPTSIRFTVPGGERDRQASAYQKGLHPRNGRFAAQRAAQPPQRPPVVAAFDGILRGCRATGSLRFEYGDPAASGCALNEEPEGRLHLAAFGDALENVADAARSAHRDRFSAVELSVVPIEF
jgi:hypothetical protein